MENLSSVALILKSSSSTYLNIFGLKMEKKISQTIIAPFITLRPSSEKKKDIPLLWQI